MTLGLVDIFEVRADGGVDCHHEKAEVEGRAHRVKDRTVADEFAGLQDQAAGEYGKIHQEDKAEQGRAFKDFPAMNKTRSDLFLLSRPGTARRGTRAPRRRESG